MISHYAYQVTEETNGYWLFLPFVYVIDVGLHDFNS